MPWVTPQLTQVSVLAPLHPSMYCVHLLKSQAHSTSCRHEYAFKENFGYVSVAIKCNGININAPQYWIADTFPNGNQK